MKKKFPKSQLIFLIISIFGFHNSISQINSITESIIKGQVIDTEKTALLGVNIMLKGTEKGTTTDFDGNFTIVAPSNGILVFSYIGYKDKEVAIDGKKEINVVLEQSLESLDEIVIVGVSMKKVTSQDLLSI
ncbi:MAG: hypothetical protein HC798_02055 [Polaribacter sp.]|nr:hypothetical protein [Polaribacter sp.]